ncbi:SurA N-terminal domain-containing protein [Advenella mimigardefordensis]|uniref:Periplasmic chaperone PpiD n=1 Tax=Advenella mimigardefordensis (strain DSM 17166 / LMG 22922 / DPN7) TaxID=1247726 RepID=W0PFW9_ADVMD|nr:SurA N-terminal domain-containing protein [Advenella mimigardefordensis]AHG63963.1 putative peptidyl-prolyl cis-trans isomerase D [Advenella mimigardefordensis DPN7]
MLESFRTHKRLLLIVLFVLVVPSFVFLGIADYQSFTNNDVKLASVRKNDITQAQFDQSWRERLNQLREQNGSNFNINAVDTPANRQAWLDQLVDNQVLQQEMLDRHFNATDNMVRQAIASTPDFQDNGKYSFQKYSQFLAERNIRDVDYEQYVRQQLAFAQLLEPVAGTVSIPAQTAALLQTAMTQERTVRLKTFEAAAYEQSVQVSDQEMTDWYEKNKQSLQVPEYVNVDYIVLNQDAALKTVGDISDADIESYYKANIAKYTKKERRQINHIQIQIPAGADEAAQKAAQDKANEVAEKARQDPASFAELAKTYSDDAGSKNQGGSLGTISKGDIASLDAAAFDPQAPGITDPVKIDNAWHVLQIANIEPGEVQPLAQLKDTLKKEIALQQASEKFADLSTKLTQLSSTERDSLQPLADALELEIHHVNGVSQTALLPKDQVGDNAAADSKDAAYFESGRVRETLFSDEVLKQNKNSGVIEISPSELMVVHVAKDVPAAVPALDDVRETVLNRIRDEKGKKQASEDGIAELAMLKEKGPGELTGFGKETTISRLTQAQLPPSMLNAIMNAPADSLPAFVGFEVPNGYAIAQIEKVTEPTADARNMFDQYLRQAMVAGTGAQTAQSVTRMIRQTHDVKVYPDAAKVINDAAGNQ